MSHHGREDERELCGEQCCRTAQRLRSAAELISAVALNLKADPSAACDAWLENNGYDCENSRRERRQRRASELDAEIDRLRAERAKL